MKKSYTAIMKEIKDANHMVLHAGTEKVKQVWVANREKLDDCLACPVLGRTCPPGCKSL
jgi:hypothetical protein